MIWQIGSIVAMQLSNRTLFAIDSDDSLAKAVVSVIDFDSMVFAIIGDEIVKTSTGTPIVNVTKYRCQRLNDVGFTGAVLSDQNSFQALLIEVDIDVFEVLEAAYFKPVNSHR
jgi:hypothetical protein